jgi:dCMP deaminase
MAVVGLTTSPTPEPQYIDSWDEYWMEMAFTVGRKSKDPKCRVGAVIVRERLMVSTGFNGFARQVFDDPSLLSDADEKLRLICHAEQNAIHNAARVGIALSGATIYVTKFPCMACTNAIIQAGIGGIYTHDSKFWNDDPADKDHSRKKSALRQARIKVEAPFHPDYAPKQVTGKQSAAPITASGPARPAMSAAAALVAVPPAKRRKNAKAAKPKAGQTSLFPARHAIDGGKSGT